MDNVVKDYFSGNIAADFFRLFCGDQLGEGSARAVYEYKLDHKLVVKIETEAESFQNIMEWETWRSVMMTEHAKWFAACHYISPCGIVMVQRKTQVKPHSKYPDRIPAFFTDIKYNNFGFIGNQLTCHDYGINLMMERGMTKRMRKADWWR